MLLRSSQGSATANTGARWNVLILCTGNSARSIMAEAIFNEVGKDWFQAYSAGSNPTGSVNPYALDQLTNLGANPASYHSKNWRQFSDSHAPQLDFVITVCDNAAAEICPIFKGKFESVHWGLPDPAAVIGDRMQVEQAFAYCVGTLQARIKSILNLPLDELDKRQVATELRLLSSKCVDEGAMVNE